MRSTGTLRWIGLALLGIVIAAGVAVAASSLVSHQIGLASEPISAGDALAPAASRAATHAKGGQRTTTTTEPSTSPPPTESTPASPSEATAPEPTPNPSPAPPSGGHDGGDTGGGGGSGGSGNADD